MKDPEYWFAKRLNRFDLFAGITTLDDRIERVRREILSRNLADVELGRKRGKVETYSQGFERAFGQPLEGGLL
jgi:hypothetical protein